MLGDRQRSILILMRLRRFSFVDIYTRGTFLLYCVTTKFFKLSCVLNTLCRASIISHPSRKLYCFPVRPPFFSNSCLSHAKIRCSYTFRSSSRRLMGLFEKAFPVYLSYQIRSALIGQLSFQSFLSAILARKYLLTLQRGLI